MLLYSIDDAAYAALPDDVRAHYVKRGASYVLDTGGEHPELVATQAQLDKARADLVKTSSDLRTANESRATFETNLTNTNKAEMDKLREQNTALTTNLVQTEVERQVNAISGQFGAKYAKLIASDIKASARVEGKIGEDGKVQLVYKNSKGEDVTFDALKDEYCKNPEYSDMLATAQNTDTMSPPAGGNPATKPAGDSGLNYNTATPAQLSARAAQIK